MKQPRTRYSRSSFEMLKILDDASDSNWVSSVRMILFTHGFGHVWLAQSVGNTQHFIAVFKQRCKDIYQQDWYENISSSTCVSFYSEYKYCINLETYLTSIKSIQLRRALTKLRCNAHNFKVQAIRKDRNVNALDVSCSFCSIAPEDEYHVLLVCSKYWDVREKYLPEYFLNPPTRCKFQLLLTTTDSSLLFKLSLLCYNIFRIRKSCL